MKTPNINPFNRFTKLNRHFELYNYFVVFLENFEMYIKSINPIKSILILIGLIGFFDFNLMVFSNNYNGGGPI
jgi:hypothetical protein